VAGPVREDSFPDAVFDKVLLLAERPVAGFLAPDSFLAFLAFLAFLVTGLRTVFFAPLLRTFFGVLRPVFPGDFFFLDLRTVFAMAQSSEWRWSSAKGSS
jgi:hypothetical protein